MTDTKKWEESISNFKISGIYHVDGGEYNVDENRLKLFISSLLLQTQLDMLEWCQREVVRQDEAPLIKSYYPEPGKLHIDSGQFCGAITQNQLRSTQRQTIKDKINSLKQT